jgi:leucyl/phenylalanyl-tRNA--protein transferase
VAFCADLSPDSVLGAYRRGIVPLPAGDEYFRTLNEVRYGDLVADGTIAVVGDPGDDPYWAAWWSPDPRPVIGAGVHLGRQVRKRLRQDGLVTTADTEFLAVAEACREGRPTRWLTDSLLATLAKLHDAGWAHSIEVWRDGELVGGAMGIGLGAVFSGDSLFGRHPGAAAVAVADLRARLTAGNPQAAPVIDAQWDSPFLRSLGAVPVAREDFLARLARPAQSPPLGPLPLLSGPLPAQRLLELPPPHIAVEVRAHPAVPELPPSCLAAELHRYPLRGDGVDGAGDDVAAGRVATAGWVAAVGVGRLPVVTSGRGAARRAGRDQWSGRGAPPRTGQGATAGSPRPRP